LDLLSPLLALSSSSPSRFSVYLYEIPLLRHFPYSSLPAELKEIAAVYHVKFFLFDETVILSGANLAHDYFVNRQDRYWLLKETVLREKERENSIIQFLNSFFLIIREDCHILRKDGKIEKVNPTKKVEDVANELKELVSSSSSSSSSPHGIEPVTIVPLIQHHSLNLKYEQSSLSLFNSFSLAVHLPPLLTSPSMMTLLFQFVYPLLILISLQLSQRNSWKSVIKEERLKC
jgi:hypothetical protein